MAATQEPVAVLGIGAMGRGMAISALRAGIPTTVWNRRPEAARDLAQFGAAVADSAAGVGEHVVADAQMRALHAAAELVDGTEE